MYLVEPGVVVPAAGFDQNFEEGTYSRARNPLGVVSAEYPEYDEVRCRRHMSPMRNVIWPSEVENALRELWFFVIGSLINLQPPQREPRVNQAIYSRSVSTSS